MHNEQIYSVKCKEADDVLTLFSECSDIVLLKAKLSVKIELFVEYQVNSPRIMAKIVDFEQIQARFQNQLNPINNIRTPY